MPGEQELRHGEKFWTSVCNDLAVVLTTTYAAVRGRLFSSSLLKHFEVNGWMQFCWCRCHAMNRMIRAYGPCPWLQVEEKSLRREGGGSIYDCKNVTSYLKITPTRGGRSFVGTRVRSGQKSQLLLLLSCFAFELGSIRLRAWTGQIGRYTARQDVAGIGDV